MKALVIVALSWTAMAVLGCDDMQSAPTDEGFRVVLVPGDTPDSVPREVELHPAEKLPHVINWDDSVENDAALREGITLVNAWLGQEVYVEPYEGSRPVTVACSVGYVPLGSDGYWGILVEGGDEPASWTRLWYDTSTGEVLEGYVLLSADAAANHDTTVMLVARGLLQVLGLDDDPSVTLEDGLYSAMANPTVPGGVLTEHDMELIEPYLP